MGPVEARGGFRLVVNRLYYDAAEPVSSGFAFDEEILLQALRNIYAQKGKEPTYIEEHLFREFCRGLDRAVEEGFGSVNPDDDFISALQHSNEVFSAFKVHRAQRDMAARLVDSNGNLKPFEQWLKDVQPIASHQCRSWFQTEYDTAVIRAHQAADWQQFERERDVLPNLKWMPSTSVNPGADHRPFWGTIRPIDDKFWKEHRPGDRWNCKCSLSNTDEPTTTVPGEVTGGSQPQPGLTGNPGQDAAVFSDDHPYFPSDCQHCAFYKPGFSDRVWHIFLNKKKDCNHCRYVNRCINQVGQEERERIKANRAEYKRLLHDDDYTDVQFDKKTGGVKATHRGHITHDGPKAQRFFEGLTSTDLERECQEQLFKLGHRAVFCDESKRIRGNRLPALDLILDDKLMDIRSVTGRGWYSNIFVTKNDQLRRFNARTDITDKADSLCLYFHDPALFDEEKMRKSINFFRFYRNNKGELLNKHLKHIHCVIKGREEVLVFDIE